jgi:hypothetical protein
MDEAVINTYNLQNRLARVETTPAAVRRFTVDIIIILTGFVFDKTEDDPGRNDGDSVSD